MSISKLLEEATRKWWVTDLDDLALVRKAVSESWIYKVFDVIPDESIKERVSSLGERDVMRLAKVDKDQIHWEYDSKKGYSFFDVEYREQIRDNTRPRQQGLDEQYFVEFVLPRFANERLSKHAFHCLTAAARQSETITDCNWWELPLAVANQLASLKEEHVVLQPYGDSKNLAHVCSEYLGCKDADGNRLRQHKVITIQHMKPRTLMIIPCGEGKKPWLLENLAPNVMIKPRERWTDAHIFGRYGFMTFPDSPIYVLRTP